MCTRLCLPDRIHQTMYPRPCSPDHVSHIVSPYGVQCPCSQDRVNQTVCSVRVHQTVCSVRVYQTMCSVRVHQTMCTIPCSPDHVYHILSPDHVHQTVCSVRDHQTLTIVPPQCLLSFDQQCCQSCHPDWFPSTSFEFYTIHSHLSPLQSSQTHPPCLCNKQTTHKGSRHKLLVQQGVQSLSTVVNASQGSRHKVHVQLGVQSLSTVVNVSQGVQA